MWTGRQTLESIERALAKVHGEEGHLDLALRSAVGDAERLRKERSDALRELARVKLDEMAAGRLVNDLDAGERRAVQILDDFRARIAAVTERREALQKEVASAEAERHAAATAVEKALADVEALRAQAEASVQATVPWRAAKIAADEADAIASEAEKKAASSESELGAKKKPYDDDSLFVYLWRRKFGTAEYSAGNIVRYVDRIAARFIGFGDARLNYAALIEIPLRLREHATGKRTQAAQRAAALADIERRAMVEAGVDAKEQVLAQARHQLAAADNAVEKKRNLLHLVDEDRTALVSGGIAPAYNEALATIASADAEDELATLYVEARRTQTDADHAIVRRIEAIDANAAKADAQIASLRTSAQDLARRRLEIEQVRGRFRHAGYDHPHATFGNEGDIVDVLRRTVEGAARSGALWDHLRGGYSYRAPRGSPDFGSPTFPFPFPIPGGGRIGSPGGAWRQPEARGGWAPTIDFPSGGSRSDDDRFTTGGSF